MYSKRERKARVWTDFETEAATESQRDNKDGKQDNENRIVGNKVDKKDTPVKKAVDDSVTSVKKGKRRSQKLVHKVTEEINKHAENGKDSNEKANYIEGVPVMEGATELLAIGNRNKKRNVIKGLQSNEEYKDNSSENIELPEEDLMNLKEAVESKRTTKYIEKCDRVIERLHESSVGDDSTLVDDKTSLESETDKVESKFSKGIKNNDFRTSTPASDLKKNETQKKTPGRKRGRPKKCVVEENTEQVEQNVKDIDNLSEVGCLNDSTDLGSASTDFDESARLLSTPVSAPVRKRGKQKLPEEVESQKELMAENNFETPVTASKRRGRKKKSVSEEINEIDKELNISQGSSRKGRKRKEINYAALEDGNDFNEATGLVVKKRGRKRKAVNEGDDLEKPGNLDQNLDMSYDQDEESVADKADDDFCIKEKTPSRKTPSKRTKIHQCHHCDYGGKTVTDIRRHYAISHQLWWSEENPEGTFDKSDWPKIFKIKKCFNCTKCDKQINFVTYYSNHFEWCGREHLTYTCEHCERNNLVLRWKQLHLKTCPALIAEIEMEKRKQDSERRKEEMKMLEETEDSGRGQKRKAARKAISMVHDISKEMDPSAYSDHSGDDPDVVLDDDEDNEDDDDEDDDDDINEEDIDTPDDDNDDVDIAKDDLGDLGKGKYFLWQRTNHFNPNSMMEEFVKENWSTHLFLDWLPWKQDWKQLSQKESEPYLPKMKDSIRFCFHSGEKPSTLHTLQSTIKDGFPMFYTGLVVWDVAWCPTNLHCTDGQFLAVTGKSDHTQEFYTDQRWAGPGLIQIWNTGIQNNKLKTDAVPKLSFNLVHDYGMATKMLWCPSGCYKTNKKQTQTDSYTRLGLLAVSFTDGTCRIFSVPLLSATPDGEVQTYKASPVITLMSYNDHEGGSYTCSSMDWIKTQGHSKVILGYSNGAVKLYNLLSKSPLQRLTTNNEVRLLPYLNLQPHGNLVRSVQFCSLFENVIVTSSEDFETVFYDLTNLGAPIHCDSGTYMTTCMFSSIWQHGVFTGSDENYAVLANKARYIDSGHVFYYGQQLHRKDEKGAYYVSSQPACIWDIQCSDWTGFVASCDNRGSVSGLMPKDLLKLTPDCKSYKHRQIIIRTIVKENNTMKEGNDTDKNSSRIDQSEHCKRCTTIKSEETLHNDKSADNQSDTSVQCTCDKTDQSACKIELSNEKHSNIKDELNEDRNEGATSAVNCKNELWKKYETLVNNSVIQFEENLKVPKFCPMDKNSDRYDRPFIAALKSVSFNPNNHQCCWLAYGGNTGLVRLVNVQRIIARVTQNDLRHKNQI